MAKPIRRPDPATAPLEPLLEALADAVALRVADRINARPPAPQASAHAPPTPTPQQWLSPAETAEHIGVSPKTLESWRSRGAGPPFVRVGSRVRYRPTDLDMWGSSQRELA